MTIKELVAAIAEAEGKASEVSIGNIREIVGIMSDILFKELQEAEDHEGMKTFGSLIANGKRRSKK